MVRPIILYSILKEKYQKLWSFRLKFVALQKLSKERNNMATNMNRKKIVVHTINIEESEKLFPTNSEVTMSPLPEGHVAKLASMHIVRSY